MTGLPMRCLGMIAYTRRHQRDGTVKVFFRDQDRKQKVVAVLEAPSAELIPSGRPLTPDVSYPARFPMKSYDAR